MGDWRGRYVAGRLKQLHGSASWQYLKEGEKSSPSRHVDELGAGAGTALCSAEDLETSVAFQQPAAARGRAARWLCQINVRVSVCVQPAWPCSCGCVLLVVMQEYVKPLLFEGGFGSDEVTEKPHEPSTRLSTSGALLVVVDVASSGNSPELQVEGVRWQVSQSPSLCSHPAHVQVASEALQRGDSTASGLWHPRGDRPHWRG